PAVTINWLLSHQSEKLTFAPSSMPVGMTNIFTTACSYPSAKNMNTGIAQAMIFPTVDWEVMAMTTPMQTIQLHRMPFTKAVAKPAVPYCAYPMVFFSARLTSICSMELSACGPSPLADANQNS